jgi:hypothetical protein
LFDSAVFPRQSQHAASELTAMRRRATAVVASSAMRDPHQLWLSCNFLAHARLNIDSVHQAHRQVDWPKLFAEAAGLTPRDATP